MNTKIKWVINIILLITVGFIVSNRSFLNRLRIENIRRHEKTFKIFDIKTTNMISNRTEDSYLDTIIYVGLNELNIDSTAVTIKPIIQTAQEQFESDGTLEANIIGKDRQYVIFLGNMSRDKAIKVLSHELIHLQQYATRKLILQNYGVIWNGDNMPEYELSYIKYNDRPWEVEASYEQKSLDLKIRKILY